jgi:uncharacterized protein YndB with AHSA1/START domain
MLTVETRTSIEGLTGREVFDFLANPSDREYQRWWPGVHLAFHTLSRADGHVGDVVFMDEYVGARRVRLAGVVVEAEPGKRLVWQFKAGIRLPVWLSLDLTDAGDRVSITHRIRAGWSGFGRVLDPLLRLYFTRGFAAAMDEHVRTEFQRLRERLHPASVEPRSTGSSADDDRRSPAPGPLR